MHAAGQVSVLCGQEIQVASWGSHSATQRESLNCRRATGRFSFIRLSVNPSFG